MIRPSSRIGVLSGATKYDILRIAMGGAMSNDNTENGKGPILSFQDSPSERRACEPLEIDEIRSLLSERATEFICRRGSTGLTAWARYHGVLASNLSEFMSGKRQPTADILDALGLERVIVRKASAASGSGKTRSTGENARRPKPL